MAGAVKCERSGASRTECGCPGCYDYRNCLVKRVDGKWCSQSDLDAAMAGKMKCDECGVVCGHGWRCSKFPVRALWADYLQPERLTLHPAHYAALKAELDAEEDRSAAMAGALTPKQRAIVEATDKALDEFGKQIVAVWFQSGAGKCAECGVVHGHHLGCSHFSWTGVPTAPAPRCECGSGSNEASGAHSHWCPRWVRP